MKQTPTEKGENAAPSARERLLSAALEVFAKHGYDDASTREITEAAGTNVASINYYFGSKLELYTELVRTRARECQNLRMEAVRDAQAANCDVQGIFRAFIHVHLCRSFGAGGPETDMALFFNELTTQGPGFETIMEEMIHPTHKVLTELLIENYPEMTPEKATLCIGSLMAQVVHFIRNRPVMKSINDRNDYANSVEELCDHIVDLTFHGLDGIFADKIITGEVSK
jgi:AcrR family transcriptional regulator